MRKLFVTTMMVLAVCVSTNSLMAQDNALKISVGNLFSGTIPLVYERAISGSVSVNIQANIGIPRSAPATITEGFQGGGDFRTTTFSITPEIRFYTGGDVMEGFYIGPYLRFRNSGYSFDGNIEGTETSGDGSWRAIGGGAQMGYQWVINDRFVIDWYFLGLGLTYQTISGEFTATDASADLQQLAADLEEAIVDVPVLGDRFSAAVEGDNISGNLGFLFPNLRTGVSVGIAF